MKYRLSVEIEVRDPEVLMSYAVAAYRAAYGDDTWVPADLGVAAVEAVVLSAPGPSPDQIGIEITKAEAQLL